MAIYSKDPAISGQERNAFGRTRESGSQVAARFRTAQDGKPSPEQLEVQKEIAAAIEGIAVYANQRILDSRHKSLAYTHLEDALMRFGKAIFLPLEEHE